MKHDQITTAPGELGPPIRRATPAPAPAPLPDNPNILINPDGTKQTAIPGNDAASWQWWQRTMINTGT